MKNGGKIEKIRGMPAPFHWLKTRSERMEKYLVPVEASLEKTTPKVRRSWKRSAIELNGRLDPAYRHELYGLLTQFYSEIQAFPHKYHVGGARCRTHTTLFDNELLGTAGLRIHAHSFRKQGVAGLDFDSKGIYLASVTRLGCLTVHDFESLYCQSQTKDSSDISPVVHFSLPEGLEFDVVRWNPANQNEVACASVKSNEMHIYDISYISSRPIEVLVARPMTSFLGHNCHRGLCDIAFISSEDSRVVSSDTFGMVSVWDRRVGSGLPCIELSTQRYDSINTIHINVDNQTIFGAGKEGIIHIWDLRGGRTSAGFQSRDSLWQWPRASWNIANLLQKIGSLKAQSAIIQQEIHSIDLNPSCPYQLAFHLDNGWSGVVDVYSSEVTHVHCPPPAWLDGSNTSTNMLNLRKPSWLPTSSVYVVGSMSQKGLHILDFHPNSTSPCHIDYYEEMERKKSKSNNNRFVPLSEGVTVCAAHPLNSTIVAGSEESSLLLVSQKHLQSESESESESRSHGQSRTEKKLQA